VHLWSKTDTILQTTYDYYDYRDYHDYDDLRAQVLCTIEPAINTSRANEFSILSQQKLKFAAQTLMATLDEVQPHQISLESAVVLESPRARMSS